MGVILLCVESSSPGWGMSALEMLHMLSPVELFVQTLLPSAPFEAPTHIRQHHRPPIARSRYQDMESSISPEAGFGRQRPVLHTEGHTSHGDVLRDVIIGLQMV